MTGSSQYAVAASRAFGQSMRVELSSSIASKHSIGDAAMPFARLIAFALAVTFAATSNPCLAQAWPNKPIRLIAVFPPGGSVDQVARILAPPLSKQLGQSVVVENIGGASGSIRSEE